MRVLALVLVCGLIICQDGGTSGASLRGFESSQWTHTIGDSKLTADSFDFLAEDPNLCFSLRENDDQRQLLCNDRRSKFNMNPFGLRFGKRYTGYLYKGALKRPRTSDLLPGFLYPRELEVPT
uniref:Kisspeptin 2 n=1 Tax=Myripristis murdjan TaxID=586833 RepID=A0A668AL96_9TELE